MAFVWAYRLISLGLFYTCFTSSVPSPPFFFLQHIYAMGEMPWGFSPIHSLIAKT